MIRFRSATVLALAAWAATTFAGDGGPAAPSPAPANNPAKPSQATPPFPREGADLETRIREKQEYIVWMYENTENQTSVIVRLKPGIESRPRQLISRDKAKDIGSAINMEFEPDSLVGLPDWQVLRLPRQLTQKVVAEEICPRLKLHPDVVECDPNGAGFLFSVATDPSYSLQWSFGNGPGVADTEKTHAAAADTSSAPASEKPNIAPAAAEKGAPTSVVAQGSAKPSHATPPFPREGTDLETHVREQQEYMVWMYENNLDQTSVILKLKPGVESRPRMLISGEKAKEIGSIADMKLAPKELLGLPNWQVFWLPKKMTEKAVEEELCPKLKQHPDVADCSNNGAAYPFGIPSDVRYVEQWSFRNGPGGGNIEKAWDMTTGSASTVVAILDSGISSHEDLSAARVLPGYDFVSDPVVANDGGGRDADPSDPGDWVTEAERNDSGPLRNCKAEDSSWHGTHIAGTIGATANNGKGTVGIDWATRLLPVRVLGKCGNRPNGRADIVNAISWAAGVDIGIAPLNPNPAKVINMSLSGTGSCPAQIQEAIDEATRRGAVVIAAAGNDSVAGSFWPATCQNVLTVVATDAVGRKAPFSNIGGGVGVSAPGTNILSTVNPGTTVPVAGSAYRAYSGTSMAAAHVSGIASLMLAAKPSLTPFEIREIIKASSKPFAAGSSVILGSCGGSWTERPIY